MVTNNFSIGLSLTIFLVSTGFFQVSGNEENCRCELSTSLNCTKFRCPVIKCGHFPSSYNLTCLCEKESNKTNGCQVVKFNGHVRTYEVRSCDEYHPFICSDSNNNVQIYAEENKTWSEAVTACEERNLHIAQEPLSAVKHTSNILFWMGTFFGAPSTGNTDVSQYQIISNISDINSTYKCEMQSTMIQLTTTTVSPSPTVNLTTIDMSPTPFNNKTLPVSNAHTTESTLASTTNNGSTKGPAPTENEATSSTSDSLTTLEVKTTSNYERTSGTSSATETSASAAITTSDTNIMSSSADSGTTTSSSIDVSTTDPSKNNNTETTTHPGNTTEISSVEIVTISDIPTATRETTSPYNITSPLHASYPSTSSSVDITVSNNENKTETYLTITHAEPSTSTKSADFNTSSSTTNSNKPLDNGSTGNVPTSTLSGTNTDTFSTLSNTAVKPKPGSSEEERQEGNDNTPILAGALSGGAVLILIGATVVYIRYRRNQNKSKRHITKASGIAGYTDKSLRGKPRDHTRTQNPIYLPDSHVSPNNLGHHGKTAPESDDENKYDHFEKKNMHNDNALENNTYDHTRLDIPVDSPNEYGVLHQKRDDMGTDLYDHTGALNGGTYGQLHQKDGTPGTDTDIDDTSF